jgi:hypothetical protein
MRQHAGCARHIHESDANVARTCRKSVHSDAPYDHCLLFMSVMTQHQAASSLVIVGISHPKHHVIPMSGYAVSMATTHLQTKCLQPILTHPQTKLV